MPTKKTKASRKLVARLLGPLEVQVMNTVWDSPRASAASVTDTINLDNIRPLSSKTILTTLTRLEAKGWLRHELSGRAFLYTATMTEDELVAEEARRAAVAFFSKFGDAAVPGLASELSANDSRLRRLRQLAEDHEQQ